MLITVFCLLVVIYLSQPDLELDLSSVSNLVMRM